MPYFLRDRAGQAVKATSQDTPSDLGPQQLKRRHIEARRAQRCPTASPSHHESLRHLHNSPASMCHQFRDETANSTMTVSRESSPPQQVDHRGMLVGYFDESFDPDGYETMPWTHGHADPSRQNAPANPDATTSSASFNLRDAVRPRDAARPRDTVAPHVTLIPTARAFCQEVADIYNKSDEWHLPIASQRQTNKSAIVTGLPLSQSHRDYCYQQIHFPELPKKRRSQVNHSYGSQQSIKSGFQQASSSGSQQTTTSGIAARLEESNEYGVHGHSGGQGHSETHTGHRQDARSSMHRTYQSVDYNIGLVGHISITPVLQQASTCSANKPEPPNDFSMPLGTTSRRYLEGLDDGTTPHRAISGLFHQARETNGDKHRGRSYATRLYTDQLSTPQDSVSHTQSRTWISGEEKNRIRYQKCMANLRHASMESSPFIPRTFEEWLQLKTEWLVAKSEYANVKMQQKQDEADSKRDLLAMGASPAQIPSGSGAKLSEKLLRISQETKTSSVLGRRSIWVYEPPSSSAGSRTLEDEKDSEWPGRKEFKAFGVDMKEIVGSRRFPPPLRQLLDPKHAHLAQGPNPLPTHGKGVPWECRQIKTEAVDPIEDMLTDFEKMDLAHQWGRARPYVVGRGGR